jgi:hypothetical protein
MLSLFYDVYISRILCFQKIPYSALRRNRTFWRTVGIEKILSIGISRLRNVVV